MVKIMSESSVAAGVRRIEAITGAKVEELMYTMIDTTDEIRSFFNNAPDIKAAIQKSIAENDALRTQIEGVMREKAQELKARMVEEAKEINGIRVLQTITNLPADIVKDLAFQLRAEVENALVVIGSVNFDKPLLTAAASDSVVANGVNIGKNIREAAKLIQGGGGGQPHFATAGGKNPDALLSAVTKLIEILTA